jgi:hypothetical protein
MKIIDKATCLCIDKRYDERRFDLDNMGKRMGKLGADWECFHALTENGDPWTPYDYVDVPKKDLAKEIAQWGYGRDGFKHHHWNALQCHKIMIQRAIDEKRSSLLIIEDDAYFTERFEEVWEKVENNIGANDYDILYLGWWVGDELDDFNLECEENYKKNNIVSLYKARQIGGLHGALINKSMFNTIMSLPENNPIDCQLNKIHNQIDSHFISPKIIHTRGVFSECEGYIINRKNL